MKETWGEFEPYDDEQFSTPLPRNHGGGRVPIGEVLRLKFPSNSRPGVMYTTRLLSNGTWVCDCPGYENRQTCWHVEDQAAAKKKTRDVPVQGDLL